MNKWFEYNIGFVISGIVICLILMLVCNQIVENNRNEVGTNSQTTIFSFLGNPIIINDSLCEQIASAANQNDMLSYNDSIIQIGDVRWRINLMSNSIALMTSVQPDDPKMKQVIQYLNSIYGNPYDGEDVFSIKWSSSKDSLNIFKSFSHGYLSHSSRHTQVPVPATTLNLQYLGLDIRTRAQLGSLISGFMLYKGNFIYNGTQIQDGDPRFELLANRGVFKVIHTPSIPMEIRQDQLAFAKGKER